MKYQKASNTFWYIDNQKISLVDHVSVKSVSVKSVKHKSVVVSEYWTEPKNEVYRLPLSFQRVKEILGVRSGSRHHY